MTSDERLDAVKRQILADIKAAFDEMLAETGGPLTAAEKRRVDRELGLVGRRPRRKKAR